MPISPVFVDPTGRRRRRVRVAALIAIAGLLGTGALVVVALLGVPIGPAAFLPEPAAPTAPVTPAPPGGNAEPGGAPVDGTPGSRPGEPRTTTEPGPDGSPTAGPATTTASAPDTAHTKGKPDTPPGRPSDLPAPPGHTR